MEKLFIVRPTCAWVGAPSYMLVVASSLEDAKRVASNQTAQGRKYQGYETPNALKAEPFNLKEGEVLVAADDGMLSMGY